MWVGSDQKKRKNVYKFYACIHGVEEEGAHRYWCLRVWDMKRERKCG